MNWNGVWRRPGFWLWGWLVNGAAGLHAGVVVDLDLRNQPPGPLPVIPNAGSLGGSFIAEADVPQVTSVAGVRGVTLDGNGDWYVGPPPPEGLTGNGARSILAWIYNPSTVDEETIFAWSRRGGPAGTNLSFNHGAHPVWGAVGHWDAPDLSWNGQQELGVWTFVAYTYRPETGETAVYTNGKLTYGKTIAPLATWKQSTTGGTLPMVLGCQNASNGVRNNGQLPGSMTVAKLQVHDTGLSAQEVAAIYNADAAGFGKSAAVALEGFAASRQKVPLGDEVTLSWRVNSGVAVSISPGVTVAAGSSSAVATPEATTTYELTATFNGVTEKRRVTVAVESGAPVVADRKASLAAGGNQAILLDGEDPNSPADPLTFEVVEGPSHGVLTGEPPSLAYVPEPGYAGEDRFTYRASDGREFSNTGTVNLWVEPPPSAPTGVSASASTVLATAVEGSWVANLQALDPNAGETHLYELAEGPGDEDNSKFTIVGHQLIAQSPLGAPGGSFLSVRVRVTDSTGRSHEEVLSFSVTPQVAMPVINEILYDPVKNQRFEYVEIHNPGATAVSIGGWSLAGGISYTFPAGTTLTAGGYAVVSMDPGAFLNEFGFVPLGPFGGKLSGEGETIELRNAGGSLVDEVDYRAEFPWPISPTSRGAAMELIHPSLDNNLGGSWRGSVPQVEFPELTYIPAGAGGWRWRLGSTEASSPRTAWRENGFVPDGSWSGSVPAPIGYGEIASGAGTLTLATTISGMQNSYRSFFARRQFTIAAGEVPSSLQLRYSQDDGILVWINGTLVAQKNVGTTDPTIATLGTNQANEGLWYTETLSNASTFLVEGVNTVAVQVFNTTLNSSDVGFDLELKRPSSVQAVPLTPGARNTVYSTVAPPQIRQVRHEPPMPRSGETTKITAKVTDPQGVGSVAVKYQVVLPGQYIPARFPRSAAEVLANPAGERPVNPAFENPANWVTLAMKDDGTGGDEVAGDSIFTAVLPAREHRTLVRYRITAADVPGAAVQVPYADDDSLNFAYFVYDGVPDYTASAASVDPQGAGKVWPSELLTRLPVYHWITRAEDMASLQAYQASQQFPNDGNDATLAARRAEEWEGALVYDGVVYDHVRTRLRGGNSRYGDNEGRFLHGKRHYKFQFNDGHHFQGKDQEGRPYPQKWGSLAVNKMFGNKGGNGWGMPEEIGAALWSSFGVPAARTHWFHFRVIDGAAEAPNQHDGDFWGIQQVVEEYEGTFLEARGMTKGNLYKMSDWIWDADRQRRYQSPDMVRDGSEFNRIRDELHGGQTAEWLQEYVNYDRWYRYSAVAEAIRHYDLFPYTDNLRHSLKNLAWYFEPAGSDPARGRCWFLPYDWDASFGPNWNNGWEHANNALYGWDMSTSDGMPYADKPAMKLEHRNVLREFRDLAWQPDQLNGLIDDRAAVIGEISLADRDRWRNAPQASGTANDDPLWMKVQDMKHFAFVGWAGSSGPTVGAGGRGAYLDSLADGPDAGLLPAKPVISYVGEPGHPLNGLRFATGAFADPQGSGTFGAMKWRVGRIEDPAAPEHDPREDYALEVVPVWESAEWTVYGSQAQVPTAALKPGLTYRARVKMKDSSGRWSHWSDPYTFTTTLPNDAEQLMQHLVVSEVNYNPNGPAPAGRSKEDYEFLELMNVSETETLDLTEVRITDGVDFAFAGSAVTELGPGARVVVVKNLEAFQQRYGGGLPVAGEWEATDNLSNSGELVRVAYGEGVTIREFEYDDEPPWPVAADGGGSTLVLRAPESVPDHRLAENWMASRVREGSPGLPDRPWTVWLRQSGYADGDDEAAPGVNALFYYAYGMDLTGEIEGSMPKLNLIEAPGGGKRLALTLRRREGTADDLRWAVETSTDLEEWESGESMVEWGTPVSLEDGTEVVEVRVREEVGERVARFVRLRVEEVPGDP